MTPEAPRAPTRGEEIDGPGRQYYDNVAIDNLMDALLELSAEVWTSKDRLATLEDVLANNGIDATELIESHSPTPEQQMARAQQRTEFVNRVFASFARRGTGPRAAQDAQSEDTES